MARSPAELHELEQMMARAQDIGRIVGVYRVALEATGMDVDECWALAQALEHRMWRGSVFGPTTESLRVH